ncbi:MAG: beta-ketoacyl-ACP synthase II [Trueperaceae bacterium]|nr:MAG: beta-ketoacyl-ACP synthase II [Trueperaceae bacterium]
MTKRAVITGMGTVNPVGLSVTETWDNLLAGVSGIAPIQAFDPGKWGIQAKIAGEVDGFDPTEYMEKKEARRLDRFSQLALVAAEQAVQDAGLELSGDCRYETGTVIASGVGGLATTLDQQVSLLEQGGRRVSPFTVPMLMPNAASGIVSIKLGAFGPCFSTASACASSADAIGVALDMIRLGRARVVITGGSEATILPLAVASFDRAQALCRNFNDEPEKASRPFDRDRSGFVLAEGAAVLILEEEEHAKTRGARILAELVGYGAGADGYHLTAPEPSGRGAGVAMRAAIRDAGVDLHEVSYINAHGTSTQLNDKVESRVINELFGEVTANIPVSSTKSMTGHLAGAAGALEALVCTKVVETGWAPPTINYDTPDPECELDTIPWNARQVRNGVALSNSFGFGGHSSCLAFRRYSA